MALELTDFVLERGRVLVASALVLGNRDAANFLYRTDGTPTGSLLAGSLDPGIPISRIRHPSLNDFQLNDNPDARSIGDFFDVGGRGRDLTIHIQDADGAASFVVAEVTIGNKGNNFIWWTVPTPMRTVLRRIQANDRFILAFTRAGATPDLMPTAGATADQAGTVGISFSVTVAAGSGGDGTLTYSASGLASWMSFDPLTRVLSGTPDVADTTAVTVTVRDADGDTDTDTFDVVITAAPVPDPQPEPQPEPVEPASDGASDYRVWSVMTTYDRVGGLRQSLTLTSQQRIRLNDDDNVLAQHLRDLRAAADDLMIPSATYAGEIETEFSGGRGKGLTFVARPGDRVEATVDLVSGGPGAYEYAVDSGPWREIRVGEPVGLGADVVTEGAHLMVVRVLPTPTQSSVLTALITVES